MSPFLKKSIGMGYVKAAEAVIGNEIYISIRQKLIQAIIVKTPFYDSEKK